MAPLLLLGESLKSQSMLAFQKAKTMLHHLIHREAEMFQKVCASFLGLLPQAGKFPHEAYYHDVLHLALFFSGQEMASEMELAWGRMDFHFKEEETKDDYIIEVKYVETMGKNSKPLGKTVVKNLTNKALREAMDQIEEKRYTKRFPGRDNKIWKVAMVFRTGGEVTVAFEEALKWHLVKTADGQSYQVEKT
jgi:tRNA nucleotidyltransferase/poly(A) polymerase